MSTAKKNKKRKANEEAVRRGFFSRLRSFFITWIIIGGILYVGLLILSRTEGFRYTIAEKVSDRLGLSITIRSSYLTPDLDLVLGGVMGGGGGVLPEEAGFSVEEVHMDLQPLRAIWHKASWVRGMELSHPSFNILREESGFRPVWLQEFIEPLLHVSRLDLAALQRESLGISSDSGIRQDRRIPRCRMMDSEWFWRKKDGSVERHLAHLELLIDQIQLPERHFEYVRIRSANGEVGEAVYDHFHVEWLEGGGRVIPLQGSIQWREPAARADIVKDRASSQAAVQHYLRNPSPSESIPSIENQLRRALQ